MAANDLNPTIPPVISGAPMPPPPPGLSNELPVSKPPVTSSGGGRKFPKKLVVVLIVLLLLIGGAFAVIKLVLPQLGLIGLGGKTELTWWGLWEDSSIVQPLIDEYQADHPNVKIVYQRQSKEDYRERLTNAFAQNSGPDIFRFHNTWTPMLSKYMSTIPSDVMSAQEYQETFYPVAANDLSVGGEYVGIPLEYDGLGMFVNEEIFATFGKRVPDNWIELRDTAIDLTIKDENGVIKQSGIALGRTENVDHWQEILALMMIQNGVDLKKPTGVLAQGALDFFTRFYKTDEVWDETQPPSTIAFANGKLAMYLAPSWRAFEIDQLNPNLKYRVYPVPQLSKETEDEPDITYASYWVEGVWDKSSNKEQAWDFLKFLSSRENLTKLYANASKTRRFGEPYPRRDMRDLLVNDSVAGGFIDLAPTAKSWYMASRTFDGDTGMNSRLSSYFEDAINAVNDRSSSEAALQTAAIGVQTVLADYGLAQPVPTATPR